MSNKKDDSKQSSEAKTVREEIIKRGDVTIHIICENEPSEETIKELNKMYRDMIRRKARRSDEKPKE